MAMKKDSTFNNLEFFLKRAKNIMKRERRYVNNMIFFSADGNFYITTLSIADKDKLKRSLRVLRRFVMDNNIVRYYFIASSILRSQGNKKAIVVNEFSVDNPLGRCLIQHYERTDYGIVWGKTEKLDNFYDRKTIWNLYLEEINRDEIGGDDVMISEKVKKVNEE